MKKYAFGIIFILSLIISGCYHPLEITNIDEYYAAPVLPLKERQAVGVASLDSVDPMKGRYVSAIIDALERSGSFDRVIYPYNEAVHKDITQTVMSIGVEPKYSGSGRNFLINFPGFLIFAPAIWGYEYHADIDTKVKISRRSTGAPRDIVVTTNYVFRQAEIDRTWTEVGWLEWGIIPLIGGFAFMEYDPDVTREFIAKVSPSYGAFVANKILQTLYEESAAAPSSIQQPPVSEFSSLAGPEKQ